MLGTLVEKERRRGPQTGGDLVFPSSVTLQFYMTWDQIQAPIIVPLMNFAVAVCLIMSLCLFMESVYMAIIISCNKLFDRRLDKRYKWEPICDDIELGNSSYPKVLIQIPMYNEKEVLC